MLLWYRMFPIVLLLFSLLLLLLFSLESQKRTQSYKKHVEYVDVTNINFHSN